ncbi:MAG: UDP-N-acetylmuramate dehydrogenase [Cyclobacteriaceae bacterium]
MIFKESISLKNLNTFGIDVKAKLYASFSSIGELISVLKSRSSQDAFCILGGGSNILFTRDFDGLVLRNEIKEIEVLDEDDQNVFVKIGAGENWHDFVLHAISNGWGGVENLSLIPGTVGAAPMQNIGAYGVEIESVFESLEAVEIETGEQLTFDKTACKFGYRQSVFKTEFKGKYIICSVALRLTKRHTLNTEYGAIRETLASSNIDSPTIKDVSDAVIAIRSSKLPNPQEIGNAGSFFKNPYITNEHFDLLKKEWPKIPGYPEGGSTKVPAAWLIDQCGWKGKREGNVGVHEKQALVLVNYGNGTGTEIVDLSKKIQKSVKAKFGIDLVPEVNIL